LPDGDDVIADAMVHEELSRLKSVDLLEAFFRKTA
jgi:hypothetical protein